MIVMPDITSINIGCLIKPNHCTIVIQGLSESERTFSSSILEAYSCMDYLSRTYRFCPVRGYCNGNTKNLLGRLKNVVLGQVYSMYFSFGNKISSIYFYLLP